MSFDDVPIIAFISVYNPLDIAIEKEIKVPLYYTGLTDKAIVKEQDKNGKEYSLARDYSISLKIRIPAKGYNWYNNSCRYDICH